MATSCDLCERALVPRGEIYYEVAIRVRPAGELRHDLTPPEGVGVIPEGLPGAPVGVAAADAADAIGAQLEELALEEFLAQALKTHKYVLCGTCRREFAADPLGKARRLAAR